MTALVKNGIFHADGVYGVDDEITVRKSASGSLTIRVDEPWAGDTETGFGRECSIDISPEDTAALIKFLTSAANPDSAGKP